MENEEEQKKYAINLSVRNLVEFILRSGDIDNRRSDALSKQAMTEGSKIHRKIQAKMKSNYRAEVSMKLQLNYEQYVINLEGRADGVITEEEDIVIDEIKGMYADVLKFEEPIKVHRAQAMCYAYIYAKQNNLSRISVQMTYCNLDSEAIKRFRETFTFEEIEVWFESVISQYIIWAEFMASERKLRTSSILNLEFPFAYRKGQREIVVSVYKSMKQSKNMFIQAPTGVGKTISTIFPAVRIVGEELADKIFYLTAKTITRTVAEEAFRLLRNNGLHFRTVTLTAKEKICTNNCVNCNPDECSRAKGHFDRVNAAIYDLISSNQDITREVIIKYADLYEVCPFEMSLDVSMFTDGIICDYNYVFDPNVYLKRYFAQGVKGDYLFLVDEAHNLVERAREMYSATIVKERLLKVKKICKDYSKRVVNALSNCNKEMLTLKRKSETYLLHTNIDSFITKMLRLQSAMEKFLDDVKQFPDREEVLDLYFEVRNFLNIYELVDEGYEIYSDYTENGEFFLKLFCVNPANNLSQCMQKGICTIFFSATLLPVNYYKELLSGDINDYAIYVESPFSTSNRIITVARDVSSKYTRRTISEYEKIIKYIVEIINKCKGNYMVFFPSYKLMMEIYELACQKQINETCDIIFQTTSMNEKERETFLSQFVLDKKKSLLAFCVLGGIFSEGIDLKNERLIGSIIIGTGLPMVCTEREILKNHYDEEGKNGFNYAYRYPGMNKVLQAAGRVIRTLDDVGVVALLDERFLTNSYMCLFPREWSDYVVTDIQTISEKIERFWKYV